ncbi:unnamed protein product [Darwinula stevensoni]|uniref:Uncharacterized protein n=1 Tax=Darwinula stevensoni TaxID=69355 RepID=A0A7R8XAH4_9CRUS|nr:unnamed protein product [Darwinula stevensoni]CAG0883796.1 unnamed protein product [Darwinula stevensoni]
MKARLVSLSLVVLLPFIPWINGQSLCPQPDDISPCSCSYDAETKAVTVVCSTVTSVWEIFSAFNEVIWPFTELNTFVMRHNDAIMEWPEGLFGKVTFENIILGYTSVTTIHPSVLISLKDRIVTLDCQTCGLQDFPWDIVPQLTHLQVFYINDYYNPIMEIPQGFFESMESLQNASIHGCQLGPVLANGTMEFHSQVLAKISLGGNEISSVESHGINGLIAHTIIRLWWNDIQELTEESFRPILEVLSTGSGYIDFGDASTGDAIVCGCSMAWIVLNPDFLASIVGTCADGIDFQDLDPEYFEDFCLKTNPPREGDFFTWIHSDRSSTIEGNPRGP